MTEFHILLIRASALSPVSGQKYQAVLHQLCQYYLRQKKIYNLRGPVFDWARKYQVELTQRGWYSWNNPWHKGCWVNGPVLMNGRLPFAEGCRVHLKLWHWMWTHSCSRSSANKALHHCVKGLSYKERRVTGISFRELNGCFWFTGEAFFIPNWEYFTTL